MNIKLLIVIIVLLGVISGMGFMLNRQVQISNRHERNFNVQKQENDKSNTSIQEMQLTARELRKSTDSTINALYLEAKGLHIKARQLEQLLSVKTKTVIKEVYIPIHDTLIIQERDTITKIATIRSKWLTVSIGVFPDSLKLLNYVSRDEIVIILHWYKNRKFFISRWFEKRKYKTTIVSKNPNSIIDKVSNIKITKEVGR